MNAHTSTGLDRRPAVAAVIFVLLVCVFPNAGVAVFAADGAFVSDNSIASVSNPAATSNQLGHGGILSSLPKMKGGQEIIIEPAEADDDDVEDANANDTSGSADGKEARPYIRLVNDLPRQIERATGERVRLNCKVVGTKPIEFRWFLNEAPLQKSPPRIKVKDKEYSSQLKIEKAQVLDTGHYRCEANNLGGRVQTTSTVRIRQAERNTPDVYASMDVPACVTYQGSVCAAHLAGQKIFVRSSRNLDLLQDKERELRDAVTVISNISDVSEACKLYATKVACYHMLPPCDMQAAQPTPLKMCRQDCNSLETDLCKSEYAAAEKSEMIGDDRLLPSCKTLPRRDDEGGSRCIPIIKTPEFALVNPTHWCYHGNGKTYRGTHSKAISGKDCVQWSLVNSGYRTAEYPELTGGAKGGHNFCRNPGGKRPRPWCYTAVGSKIQEENCGHLDQCKDGDLPELAKQDDTELSASAGAKNKPDSVGGQVMSTNNLLYIGSACFGVVLIALFALFLYCCIRRKKMKKPGMMLMANGNGALKNGAGYAYHGGNGVEKQVGNGMSPAIAMNGQTYTPGRRMPSYSVDAPQELQPMLPAHYERRFIEIPLEKITFSEKIGDGQFGEVWLGTLAGYNADEPMQVAIKSLKDDLLSRQKFQHEAEMVSRFRHPNIVELLGVCLSQELQCMVFEYMIHGDLHDFLRLRSPYNQPARNIDNEGITLDHGDFMHIATQIAAGMEYLAGMHYVHRDLAARNCLVTDRMKIKISDFGLARECYSADYYRLHSKALLPIRWMAPEAVMYMIYSEHSDVYAYGVTLWEMYSYGARPYESYANEEVIDLIRRHELLECPAACRPAMYQLMVECWQETASRRPTFGEIHARLRTWSMVSSPAHSSAVAATAPASGQNYRQATATGARSSVSTHSGSHSSRANSAGTGPAHSSQTATTQLSGAAALAVQPQVAALRNGSPLYVHMAGQNTQQYEQALFATPSLNGSGGSTGAPSFTFVPTAVKLQSNASANGSPLMQRQVQQQRLNGHAQNGLFRPPLQQDYRAGVPNGNTSSSLDSSFELR